MTTKCKKKKVTKKIKALAYRYECAWHECFYQLPDWQQTAIINDPHGHMADQLSKDSIFLAESDIEIGTLDQITGSL